MHSGRDLADAQAVCDKLGIELHTVNFAAEYWDNVFELFLAEYKAGRTPNPDILCNKEIKFKAFREFAAEDLGADYIATGHYVRRQMSMARAACCVAWTAIKTRATSFIRSAMSKLRKACSRSANWKIRRCVRLLKISVWSPRRKKTLPVSALSASVNSASSWAVISRRNRQTITVDGDEIGEHQGLMYHTLGQRKGLGIGGTKDGTEEPWYVVDKDVENNILIVAQGHEHPRLMSVGLIAQQLHWVDREPFTGTMRCTVKTRYRQTDIPCTVKALDADRIEVIFDEPVAAVTPGQSAVFYNGEVCLGGGIIEQRLPLPV